MDISTVENKLRQEDYQNDKEFEDDIQLIWDNALLFNHEGSDVYIMAQDMKAEF